MKLTTTIIILFVLFSGCFQGESDNKHLKERIALLDAKVDSLQKVISRLSVAKHAVPAKSSPKKSKASSSEPDLLLAKPSNEPIEKESLINSPSDPQAQNNNSSLTNSSSQTSNSNQLQQKTETQTKSNGQCRATTKKGSQCSRSAGANGYCWQHKG